MSKIDKITFVSNWNNKLFCKCFTTMRLNNHFYIGNTYNIELKGKIIGEALLIDKKSFYIKDLNEWIAHIDTGYNVQECKNILLTMYKNKNINWDTQIINLYLLKYINQSKT